ncbi:FxsA protein [hydrothermal vent metagenome]|uniref:FxsA protein n=1 Tax=hydrothermal vent metagenome TaxID=652676 RepID=A0A3B0YGR6_9ZZZZ
MVPGMNPVAILFLLFLAVPAMEIYFLIKVGSAIGAISTIALVVFTALLGAMLLRFQGWMTLQRARMSMAHGQLPATEMMEGVLLVFSGALLLTPGFVTDSIGFLLLIPPLRKALVRGFISRSSVSFEAPQNPAEQPGHKPRTIEGEYRREDD